MSRQELRASGATEEFADLVRRISSIIRTDTSNSDVLLLNDMKLISITSRDLDYGISVDSIFWVKNNVIKKEMVRESKDEEIIADLIAYMLLTEVPRSSSEVLDEYYGLVASRKYDIQAALRRQNPEIISSQFVKIYDEIRKIIDISGRRFNELISNQALQIAPRYFQVIFLSIYELLFLEKMEIFDYDGLINKLTNIAPQIIITTGGNWSASNKKTNVNSVKGIIRDCFKLRESDDPALDSWVTEFETLLMNSKTEQTLYDSKQGFTKLDGKGEFDQDSFNKIIKTLTAMANKDFNSTGYVCVGIADDEAAANRINTIYNVQPVLYRGFYITGIGHEADILQGNLDKFYRWLVQLIQNQPIAENVKNSIGMGIKLIPYYGKDVLVFKLKSDGDPILYGDKYFQRVGANVNEIKPSEYPSLFRRFSRVE